MLKGQLGFKGERGYSAYEIAVQNGYEGSEQDWLASLGTSSYLDQVSAVYTTTEASEDTFDLPANYTSDSTVEVYTNGLKLTPEEITIDTTEQTVILTTPITTPGTQVEVLVKTMATTALPISDTLSSSSTNDTAAGSKVVYDALQTKYSKTETDALLKITTPTGGVMEYAGATAPTGWLICDGSAVSRTTYADLFTAIGTTYGAGDEESTFNLPNIKGKVIVGYDSTQTEFNALGETGGEKTHTLSINEIPSHSHQLVYYGKGSGSTPYLPFGSTNTSYVGTDTGAIRSAGGSQAHNNLQPYIVMNYIIKY